MKPYSLFNRLSRTASVFLSILVLISVSITTFPQKTNAQMVVNDPLNMIQNTITAVSSVADKIKGYSLDPIAWMIAKAVLQSVVKSTVNSINKGPNGTPGFVTNLNATLQAVGDTAANGFISQLSSNGAIKSPFQTAVASSVGNNYLRSTGSGSFFAQNAFTLNSASPNPTAFLGGNFNQGGLNAWTSAWSNPQNNPFGASMLATNGLSDQVSNAQGVQKTELNQGAGFAASRGKCPTTTTGGTTQKTTAGANVGSLLTSLSANSTCQSSSIQTPGSTIKAVLDKAFGSGIDTLVSAHTLDEMVNSLLAQLITQVTKPGGVSGVSQPIALRAAVSTSGTSNATTVAPTTAATYFDLTDPAQTAMNNALSSNFASTLAGQITQLQQFQANWTTINNAALAAKTALTNSICSPNAQATITNTVQPIIDQAAIELAQVSAGISAIQSIQAEVPAANSTADKTTALSTASTDFSCLEGNTGASTSTCKFTNILPSSTDIAYATTQSNDTTGSTSGTPSLYTQMTQLTTSAKICLPLVH